MASPIPGPAPAKTRRPIWSRITLWLCAALMAVSVLGLGLGELGNEQHGFVHAQTWDHPYLWLPVLAASTAMAIPTWLRWRWVTLAAVLLGIPAAAFLFLIGAFVEGVSRGEPVVSPTERWAVRVDNRGFMDPLYATVAMERGKLTARYWQAGETFWPDPVAVPDEVFQKPRWTGDDTFEVRSTKRSLNYRMTPDGPVSVPPGR